MGRRIYEAKCICRTCREKTPHLVLFSFFFFSTTLCWVSFLVLGASLMEQCLPSIYLSVSNIYRAIIVRGREYFIYLFSSQYLGHFKDFIYLRGGRAEGEREKESEKEHTQGKRWRERTRENSKQTPL